jgi:uncharacterized protein (DUF2147 family)
MQKRAVIFWAAMALSFSFAGQAAAQSFDGTWLSQSGETRVRVAPCGGSRCGTIVWTKTGGKDEKNPDASKRNRDLVGVQMMFGMQTTADGWSGSLYDYTSGKVYQGKMKLSGANGLELSGCVMGGLICRSQTWTRAN